jgi:flagellar assembly protein FliH
MQERNLSDPPVKEETQKWNAPLFEGMSGGGFLTASHLEDLQQQAYEEARAEGFADGVASGKQEALRRIERLGQLLESLAKPYQLLDETVEQQLAGLAIAIAKQLFRRELGADPSHVVGVVREAIGLLPGGSRDVTVRLHPEDAELVRELLVTPEGERAWSIIEDPLIDRGGCRVQTENSQIDAQTEKRFEDVVKSVIGDTR